MWIIYSLLMFVIVNLTSICRLANTGHRGLIVFCGCILYILLSIFPSIRKFDSFKMRILHDGTRLLKIFLASSTLSVIFLFVQIFGTELGKKTIIINSIMVIIAEFVLFWNGIIRVYCTSLQLGIKWRVIGAVCGMIPVVNLIILIKIISTTDSEFKFERKRNAADRAAAEKRLCATKYPILLVHGVFFRDTNFFNYWGRIPDTLIKNGAQIFYGQQQSAASVEDSAKELAARIKMIVEQTGCGKLNIIAHSKGGLDSRYAISRLGMDEYIASLTTVNTPHRGCVFADYLLEHISDSFCLGVASKYNFALKKLGDTNPDFLAAVNDLTASACKRINEECPDKDGVLYRSIGSKLNKSHGGQFPLNLSYLFVKRFDGPNDGLVSEDSMKWGENFVFFEPSGKRGISHGDVIDLNRQNIKGFDVREEYIKIVNELKNKGL